MSFKTIFRYVMGVNKDISGRCEKERVENNERFETVVKAHNDACDRFEQQSTEIATQFALERVEREKQHYLQHATV